MNIDDLERRDFFDTGTEHHTTTARCDRCGALCRVAPTQNPDARLLRHATTPSGLCANCAVTEFLQRFEFMHDGALERLRAPHIQDQFAALMRTGNADATPDEIDWEHVIAHWYLPFLKPKRGRR